MHLRNTTTISNFQTLLNKIFHIALRKIIIKFDRTPHPAGCQRDCLCFSLESAITALLRCALSTGISCLTFLKLI
jgi:hypothetical protein